MSMRQHNDQKDQFFYDKDNKYVGRVADKQSIELDGAGMGGLMALAAIPAPCIVWKVFVQKIQFEEALDALRSPGCWAIDALFWGVPALLLYLWLKD
jgi:hypothetical protein